MTENPGSPKNEQSLKALITKGVVGAISIAGATAIPLLVQKFLNPPAAVNQVPTVPAQVAPTQTPVQASPGGAPAQDVSPGGTPTQTLSEGIPVRVAPEGMPVQFQPGLDQPVRIMVRSDDDDDDDDDRLSRTRKRSKKKD